MTKGQLKGIEICGEYHDIAHIVDFSIQHGYVTIETWDCKSDDFGSKIIGVRLTDRFDRVRFYINGPDSSD